MEKIELTIIPEVVYNEEDKEFTIYDSNNKGGAIVSDTDRDKAMEKFKEGTQLSVAVRNLLSFKDNTGKWYVANIVL